MPRMQCIQTVQRVKRQVHLLLLLVNNSVVTSIDLFSHKTINNVDAQ